MIYLDHNATTPMALEIREAMLPFLTEEWGIAPGCHSHQLRQGKSICMKPKRITRNTAVAAQTNPAALVTDLRELILSARQTVALGVNAALALLYGKVGQRIRMNIPHEKRAEYGREIFSTLSGKLVAEFGRVFSQQNLFRMTEFAEAFPDEKIVATIGLVAFCGAAAAEKTYATGFLPYRTAAQAGV